MVLVLTNVKIELYQGGSLMQTIISSTENDGIYTWTEVTPSLQDGIDYKVRISSTSDPGTYDESDEFQISQPGYKFVLKWGSEGTGRAIAPRGKIGLRLRSFF